MSKKIKWISLSNTMRNGVDSTFELKETILDFFTKFAQKEFFQSKTVKVSITIKYCKFE